MIMTFCKESRLGYQSMYFCSLATIVCLYSSIRISFKSIKKENEIRTLGRLTGIAQNQKKVETVHT